MPVYVVERMGKTVVDPDTVGLTVPTPLLIENDEVFVVTHEIVADCPLRTTAGRDDSVQVGASET